MTSTDPSPNQPTDANGATGILCTWAYNLTLAAVPAAVRTRAQHLLLDGLACALVGAHLPWSTTAAHAIFNMESPHGGNCEVIGWDRRVSPLAAALLNSTFIQGFELDDWHSEAPLHSNSIVLPALFAAAEHLCCAGLDQPTTTTATTGTETGTAKIDGKTFLLAYLLGLEVGPRIGLALHGPHMLTRGWHSGAVFGPSASSLAASKLLGLDAAQMEDALGMACTQACGLMSAQFESDVKRMQHGFAARNGLLAALLARGGYGGIKRVLERGFGGFLGVFGGERGYVVGEVTRGLGDVWQTWGVRVKPYAAMAGTHPTVDCVRALQATHPEKLGRGGLEEAVESIRLEMGEAAFHHGGWRAERPLTATGAQMSNAYVAATQLIDGQVLPAQFRHDKLESDEVWALVDRTSCEHNKEFDNWYSQRATITFKDGSTITAMVKAAKGVDSALTNEEIVGKWRLTTKGVIDDERRERIERLCLNFEAMDDVMELLDLLAGTTKNPIE